MTIGVHFNLLTLSTILSTDKSCILKFHVVVIFCRWLFHDLKMVFLRLLRILFVDDLPHLKTTKCRLTPSNQSTTYIRNQSGCQPSACRSRGFPNEIKKKGLSHLGVPPLSMADVICKCLPYTVLAPSNATVPVFCSYYSSYFVTITIRWATLDLLPSESVT